MMSMEEVIDSEARSILEICNESTVHSNLIMALSKIKKRTENILQTLNDGDPE
jgi:hypothetical protein